MHILSCFLTLLIACAAPSAAAGDTSLYLLLGSWRGNITSTPDDCLWVVNSAARGKKGVVTGTFTYAGKCSPKKTPGTFTLTPAKPDCFTAVAGVSGMPDIKLTGCTDSTGLVSFHSPIFDGTLRFAKPASSFFLEVDAGMGGASGTMKRLPKKRPAGSRGSKRKPKYKAKPGSDEGGLDGSKPLKVYQSGD